MKMLIFKHGFLTIFICASFIRAHAMELPENIAIYLETNRLTEYGVLPLLETRGKTFVEYVLANRIQILNSFPAIATNPAKQKLLLAAIEFATPTDYLAALNKVCDLKESNIIENDVFEFAFRATPIRKGFLSYNYQNPQVQTVVKRAQTLLPNSSEFQAFLNAVLHGSQKAIDRRYFELNEVPEPRLLSQ